MLIEHGKRTHIPFILHLRFYFCFLMFIECCIQATNFYYKVETVMETTLNMVERNKHQRERTVTVMRIIILMVYSQI